MYTRLKPSNDRWNKISVSVISSFLIGATLFTGTGLPASVSTASGSSYLEPLRSVLKRVDQEGNVNYSLLKEDRRSLDEFAVAIAQLGTETYSSWTEAEKLSFWINTYNGLTVLAIVNHYPIEASWFRSLRFPKNSIRQISGVWDELRFEVMQRFLTLDEIEHEILRKEFNEPRIHFALVCAAKSCPPLRTEPYQGQQLEEQLEDQAMRFLTDEKKFRIDWSSRTVYLSKIFSWYGTDFVSRYGDQRELNGMEKSELAVINYISSFLPEQEQIFLRKGEYHVRYLEYDWSLNER